MADLKIIVVIAVVFTLIYGVPIGVYYWRIRSTKLKIINNVDGSQLISYRWLHSVDLWFVTLLIGFICFLFVMPKSQWGMDSSSCLALVIFIPLSLLFGYSSLAGFVNRTTISINPIKLITVTYGPLIVLRRPHIQVNNVVKITYQRSLGNSRIPPLLRYPITAETQSGKKVELIHNIDLESAAIAVVNSLNQRLSL